MTYADLESAATVVLAGFEPEDEAGAIFLRLRKAALHHRTRVLAIAPFTTRGLTQDARHPPADHARRRAGRAVLAARPRRPRASTPPASSWSANASPPCPARSRPPPTSPPSPAPASRGCRAGPATAAPSRPAACRSCCPAAAPSPPPPLASTPPPPGASTRCPRRPVATATPSWPRSLAGELGGLVIGGVDPADTTDPAATTAAIDAGVVRGRPRPARQRRHPGRRRRVPGRTGHRQGRHVRHLGGPRPALRRRPQQPGLAARPAHPRRHRRGARRSARAARSASAPSPRSARRWPTSAPGTAPAPP